ncbi:MAG: PfkB family carbohydrate kinase [Planktomarina sp.]|nr:PfkB family carbohydrate kinase [Planktomarina sp.]
MSEAARIRNSLNSEARIVFVSGNFNVLHPGHVRLLRFAKELGNYLVVGVNPDDAQGVEITASDRLEAVSSNRYVNAAFAIDEKIEDALRNLRPAIVVKGREHENLFNAEAPVMEDIGGKLVFSSGEMLRSSFSEMDDEVDPRLTPFLPDAYMARHKLTSSKLVDIIQRFQGLRVLVIGDLIVDDYIDCDPLGMSQEDPTLVVSPRQTNRFVGGAGIVAAHGQSLGAQVTFLSVTGADEVAKEANERLQSYGVTPVLLSDETRPTTLKQRFRASGKTLLRVSHLRQHSISRILSNQILTEVSQRLSETDLILFSDFNYGCLPDIAVNQIIKKAHHAGVPVGADSQSSSQIGNIARFKGLMLVTPTELEAQLSIGTRTENLLVLSEQILRKADCSNLIMTLGADGVLIRTGSDLLSTDRINALNPKPRDVAGAGDSLFCMAALALTTGANIWSASLLGSIAAACQVSKVGNTPLSAVEVVRSIKMGAL